MNDLEIDLTPLLSVKCFLEGEELVEYGPSREDVRPFVDLFVPLLRRHVAGGPHQLGAHGPGRDGPGQTEIEDFYLT